MRRTMIYTVLVVLLAATTQLYAAGGDEAVVAGDEKPVLKFLGGSIGVFGDPNEGPTKEALEAITGYQFEVTSLPTENSAQVWATF